MLKKLEMKNFKNFKDTIIIDFSKVGGYHFNEECISNQTIAKMIIYGSNATGKTNLGEGLFDISYTLAARSFYGPQEGNYLNADADDPTVDYKYTFQFGEDELIYQYRKYSVFRMYDEELFINGIKCFYYNFKTKESDFENLGFLNADTIVIDRYLQSKEAESDNDTGATLPFLRWLISNTALAHESVLIKLDDFINRMAMIRINYGMAARSNLINAAFVESLTNEATLNDFEEFLNTMGIKCKLAIHSTPDGQSQLYFKHERLIPFFENASSGTRTLTNLYRVFESGRTASIIFLDEFDAFYHYEMAEKVITYFKKKYRSSQIIFTTHNTNLMTNRLMRPDCLFILSQKGKLTALCDATARELREGHNLEKMYISGEFEEYE